MTAPGAATGSGRGALHHAAQRGVVRMLYDPGFAEGVRRAPAESGLPAAVAALLCTIDPRALGADPLRRRRTLGTLCEELKASAVMALDEGRSLALLEGFFGAPEFHAAVEEEAPLVLALAAYLRALCRTGRLRTPQLPDVIALEEMQARARREAGPVAARAAGSWPAAVRLAPGVLHRRLGGDVLEVVARVDELLFEQALLPGMALADDVPRLRLPAPDPARPPLSLLAVPLASGLSLVPIDDELTAIAAPLSAAGALGADPLLARAAALGLPRERARALVLELLDDEVLEAVAP